PALSAQAKLEPGARPVRACSCPGLALVVSKFMRLSDRRRSPMRPALLLRASAAWERAPVRIQLLLPVLRTEEIRCSRYRGARYRCGSALAACLGVSARFPGSPIARGLFPWTPWS